MDDTHTRHCAGIGAQHTTQMQRAQTSWADRSPECSRHKTILPSACGRTPPPHPSPPAATASTTTPTSGILPCLGHNATYVPCTQDHAHTGTSDLPRHDEFCRKAIPSIKCRERADDAAASSIGDAHDGTLLCFFSVPPC